MRFSLWLVVLQMVDLDKRQLTPEVDARFGWRVATVSAILVGRLYWLVLVKLPGLVSLIRGRAKMLVLVLVKAPQILMKD
jgi:hypothetical protein